MGLRGLNITHDFAAGVSTRSEDSDHSQSSLRLFERVLIPVGLVSDSQNLLSAAETLAAQYHGEFRLLHAHVQSPREESASPAKDVQHELTRFARHLRNAGASKVEVFEAHGHPAQDIEELATLHRVTLILLSEETEGVAANSWFGTVTQRLTRRLQTPLLILRPGQQLTFSRVLCVLDQSDSARSVFAQALSLARSLQAPLTALRIIPKSLRSPISESPIWTAPASATLRDECWLQRREVLLKNSEDEVKPSMDPACEQRLQSAQLELDDFIRGFDLSNCNIPFEALVTCGAPVTQTLATAQRRKAGLIVVSSGPQSGFIQFMARGIAEGLAESSDRPVLVVGNSRTGFSTSATITANTHKLIKNNNIS
jgi:nucleotide-binding universal stress UspA family protein